MEDVTGDLMAGVVVGLSRITGARIMDIIDSLGVGETDEERRADNKAWTRLIVEALLTERILAKERIDV